MFMVLSVLFTCMLKIYLVAAPYLNPSSGKVSVYKVSVYKVSVYKVVISVCPILTQKTLGTDLLQIWLGNSDKTQEWSYFGLNVLELEVKTFSRQSCVKPNQVSLKYN